MIGFADFFAAVHAGNGGPARSPYPWQAALAERLARGDPPRSIAVPTGAGKTATIDALVWALAVQADRPPAERTVGVRIVWAIDRRILVDQVQEHVSGLARLLAGALGDPSHVLHEPARRLQRLAGGDAPPLVTTRWRGGLRAEVRARRPFQPEIITSTVAQIGSRLLFRGYGVGERSLALEAALAAVDTTLCLDEAHLVEPFRQTVDAVAEARRQERVALPGLTAITLTATPLALAQRGGYHGLGDADEQVLRTRLTAEKVIRLVELERGEAGERDALTDAVESHLAAGARVIACVVNTVAMALDVHEALGRSRPEVERALLIGPQRPVDRASVLQRHGPTLFERVRPQVPLVCVATQTFEVGLDADVEALVTQSASASALVQRLGRLNRAGLGRGSATIVRDTGRILYVDDEPAAWEWLRSMERDDGTIDGSVRALRDARDRPVDGRRAWAPALTDDVVELLAQTAPRPAAMADPDVEPFLHGTAKETTADVGVCWRCDLRIQERGRAARAYREALLRAMPPGREEILTLSIARARSLLWARFGDRRRQAAHAKSALLSVDVEGWDDPTLIEQSPDNQVEAGFVVLRGGEMHEVSDAPDDLRLEDVRPGDVLVLPTTAGGYVNGALQPRSSDPVADVAADVRDGEAVDALRISRDVLGDGEGRTGELLRLADRVDRATDKDARRAALSRLLEALGPLGARLDADAQLRRLTIDDRPLGLDLDDDEREPLEAEAVFAEERAGAGPAFILLASDARTPEEIRPPDRAPPTLDDHASAVAALAGEFARQAALPAPIAAAVVLAARAHDHGKADPRMQAFFRGGAPALGEAPLAKSVFGTADRETSRRAREASGLPRGLRHELASVAVLHDAIITGQVTDAPADVDRELALHLVGTHHGLGRPLPRLPAGPAGQGRAFAAEACGVTGTALGDALDGWDDGAWLRRFFRVVGDHGAWGTAYLEALLVLADRIVSAEGG